MYSVWAHQGIQIHVFKHLPRRIHVVGWAGGFGRALHALDRQSRLPRRLLPRAPPACASRSSACEWGPARGGDKGGVWWCARLPPPESAQTARSSPAHTVHTPASRPTPTLSARPRDVGRVLGPSAQCGTCGQNECGPAVTPTGGDTGGDILVGGCVRIEEARSTLCVPCVCFLCVSQVYLRIPGQK